ncbi:hypothetical protein FRACA_320008 [Frankia canadensis]|uniref:Uncharacterized protein n=1 Tax=Frankia canadensis TaxID=1836972 RepID=A0A2I2KUI2_9ACTN|nr:hypothetical protein FRACA_320008 [Frankia canadensis]SOU56599.1 hypothetical protein FRACA_320008 [Frankia canadensis]
MRLPAMSQRTVAVAVPGRVGFPKVTANVPPGRTVAPCDSPPPVINSDSADPTTQRTPPVTVSGLLMVAAPAGTADRTASEAPIPAVRTAFQRFDIPRTTHLQLLHLSRGGGRYTQGLSAKTRPALATHIARLSRHNETGTCP